MSLVRIIRDPNRLGDVFSLADHLIASAAPERIDELLDEIRRSSPEVARALIERPRLGKLDLAELAALPAGTLGQVFAEHMQRNRLDPDALPSIPSPTEIEYFRAHLYETHDIWHAVTGFETDVAGELGLQAFYLAQLPGGLPAAILGGSFFNTLLYAMDQRDARMREIVRGWLLGKRAKPFFGVRWRELFGVPMAEVRDRLGVDRARAEDSLAGVVLAEAA